ncbi:transcription factor GLABRA 3 [Citrus sinensis]|nr:transcription factor GLABRA 3 [Citrus sinensis]
MASAAQNQEGVPEILRKQLAVAVRSIQWSYAIFWSLSAAQQGVLEWGDGYYNGDIKTRKTMQAMELTPDKIGLQRSKQLRELYESLLKGESELAYKRPSAALSPEDLTDAECLPGRALANSETIWLCNAQCADSKVFSRSLLAKTVICFPHLDGVIELGVTELVPEDPSLLQHIKASLLDFSKPFCSEKSSSPPYDEDDDSDPLCAKVSHEILDTVALESLYSPGEENKFDGEGVYELHGNINEELHLDSADECSKGCEHNHQTEESFMVDGINGAASQVQSWHFVDDDLSNGIPDSMHSSDHKSESLVNQAEGFPSSKDENMSHIQLKELQEGNHTKLSLLDLGIDDGAHYRKTLSAIFGSSNRLTENPCFLSVEHKSSFVDKASILSDTIKYLKKLEARVEELESCMYSVDSEPRPKRNYTEMVEQTSDNYDNKKLDNHKKPWINKRKACDIDETDPELNKFVPKDGLADVKVSIQEMDVLIEMRCPSREYILLDIMDAINNLHLDAYSVVSSNLDGVLTLALKSTFRGAAIAPAGIIEQALWKIAGQSSQNSTIVPSNSPLHLNLRILAQTNLLGKMKGPDAKKFGPETRRLSKNGEAMK